MPWKETNAMKEKQLFIEAMLKQNRPFRELCREWGISEKTGYKWRKRFSEEGDAGLAEGSSAPQDHPNTIDGDTAAEMIRLLAACLNIRVRRTTGNTSELIMSFSTFPAPTLGS